MRIEHSQLFGPDSINPRERRSFAHAKLHELRTGKATLEEALTAVFSAMGTKKGRDSHFENVIAKAAPFKQRTIARLAVTGQLESRRIEIPQENITIVRKRDEVEPPETHHTRGHENALTGGRTRGALPTSS